MQTDKKRTDFSGAVTITSIVVWLVAYFGSRYIIETGDLSDSSRLFIALVPIVPFAIFLWIIIKNISSLDEMHRRIHLTALAFAFPMTMLLIMTLGLVQIATPLSEQRWGYRNIWGFLPLLYSIGLALAWRRYK